MKTMKFFVSVLICLSLNSAYAQVEKKIIDHTVYNDWKSLSHSKVSPDGNFLTYEIKPHRGDGYLYIYNVKTEKLDSIFKGTSASFSGNSGLIAYKITPGFDTLRTCELEKIDKKKWPKDVLEVRSLLNDSTLHFENIKSFEFSEQGDYLAVLFDDNTKKSVKKKRCKKKRIPEYESTGNKLLIVSPFQDSQIELFDVKEFVFSEKSNFLAYTTHYKNENDSIFFNVLETVNFNVKSKIGSYTDVQKMTFDKQETKLAFISASDSLKLKTYELNYFNLLNGSLRTLADTTDGAFVGVKSISVNYHPRFTNDGKRLYFGANLKPIQEVKDTLLDSEKPKLDIWHYEDKRLQPQQLLELKRDEKRADIYVYNFDNEKIIQLSNDTLDVTIESNLKGEFLLGSSTEKYAHTYNWELPRKVDYYLVSIETGEVELLEEGLKFGINLAPSGNKYTYYDLNENGFILKSIYSDLETCITCSSPKIVFTEDVNGMPMDAYPFGTIGWDKSEENVFIQSKYDIWQYNLSKKQLLPFSNNLGSDNKIQIRSNLWSRDSVYFDLENYYFEGFDEKTKGTHIYQVKSHSDHFDFLEEAYFDASVNGWQQSKDKSKTFFRKMTFTDYPEIFQYDEGKIKQLSNTNPQQAEFNWGTVELINWESYDGIPLEGLLYKPENFDSTKSYPLMVYFYELYSDRLHSHYIPKPTASIIYATEYASAGYVVFMPDIRYKEGHPANSAYDCIMSGTDKVLSLYSNIDSTKMALQGQSWGGYQTAQLITMTNRYKAAMAGAPVSNMFSAYGGMRWGSGLNRQFQYEKTQSRIGYTIWEKPELYVENSPLFHLPNVTTPLLIMHNDEDGAVPWYQGIELFTGLKRLNKTAWMLNYNGDDHNLMKNANRIDLSIRMRQFFDHYLMDKPAPEWMEKGIPAIDKGKKLGY